MQKETAQSDFDDFDDEDIDDLGDLLNDDDESDTRSKSRTKNIKEPETTGSESSLLSLGEVKSKSVSFEKQGATLSISDKNPLLHDTEENTKHKSPKKISKSKLDLFFEEEEQYAADLELGESDNISAVSNLSKDKPMPPPAKPKLSSRKSVDVEFDDDDDILNDLESAQEKSSPEKAKRQTFMDDLLGKTEKKNDSPVKKIISKFEEDSGKGSEKDDVMVYGGYVPSASSSNRASSGRRKSVMFDDEIQFPKSPSPSKQSPIRDLRSKIDKPNDAFPATRRPRSELKSTSSVDIKNSDSTILPQEKKEDMWRDFFKNEPVASNIPTKTFQEPQVRPTTAATETSCIPMQKKNSASDWLDFESPLKQNTDKLSTGDNALVSKENTFVNSSDSRSESSSHKEYPWLSDSPSASRRRRTELKQTEINESKVSMKVDITESSKDVNRNILKDEPSVPKVTQFHSAPSQIALTSQPSVAHQEPTSTPFQQTQTTVDMPHQALISTLQFERDQLLKSADAMTKKKDEDLKNFETTLKTQQQALEETLDKRMKALENEHEIDLRKLKAELKAIQDEKRLLVKESEEKFRKLDGSYEKEVQKLKEFHSEAISMLKRDHEDMVDRLKHMRDQEIEAMSSNQLQSKSLQMLSEQLEARTADLAALKIKVDDKHHTAIKEKEAMLMAKERDLKTLENRLHWQMEEGDHERTRLQQLVLSLEKRLQQQTKESEEDRWDVQQLKAKLEVQQKFLNEEKRLSDESLGREKEKLQVSQNAFLQEQKTILIQLAQERQQITSERMQLEALSRRIREDEVRLNARKFSEENNIESLRRQFLEDNEKLYLEKELSKQEVLRVRTEKEILEREKRQLKEEKEKINEMKHELKHKVDDMEDLTTKMNSEREESRITIATARRIESDHHTRMNEFTQQMQKIMEKEKSLLLEQECLAEEKREFQKSKDHTLCVNCKLAIGLPLTARPPAIGQVQQSTLNETTSITNFPSSSNIDPNLMVWYTSAEKDREYLQEQLAFLKSLRKDWKKFNNQ